MSHKHVNFQFNVHDYFTFRYKHMYNRIMILTPSKYIIDTDTDTD